MSYLLVTINLFIILLNALSTDAIAAPRASIHKVAGLELGYGTFSLSKKIDQTLVFPVANFTGALAYTHYSAVLNISGSMSDATVSEEQEEGNANRRDLDLTTGYQFNKLISAFVGYKHGKTEYHWESRDYRPPEFPFLLHGNEYYKQSGLFGGLIFNWEIENAGKLSFSMAYANLTANNFFVSDGDEYDPNDDEPIEFDDINGRTNEKSRGYSYSIAWSTTLKGHLIFRCKLRGNQYQQDIHWQGQTFRDITESTTMLTIGLTSIF